MRIQEAIDEKENGNTLQFTEDVSLNNGLSMDKDIILDLNGNTFTSNRNANEEGNENALAIIVSDVATIKNGTLITNNGACGIQANSANTNLILETEITLPKQTVFM